MLLLCTAGMTRYLESSPLVCLDMAPGSDSSAHVMSGCLAFHGLAATLPRHAPGACHSWPAEVPCLMSRLVGTLLTRFSSSFAGQRLENHSLLTPSAVLCWPDRGPRCQRSTSRLNIETMN